MTEKIGEAAVAPSRRDMFRGITAVGVAALAGAAAEGAPAKAPPKAKHGMAAMPHAAAPAINGRDILTAAEAEILDAVVDRLIPADDHGPGAKQAGATRYIDRALAGPLLAARPSYSAGLAALDDRARERFGAGFAALDPAKQDAVLGDAERGDVAGCLPDSKSFFAQVRLHALQGTFGDPYYGGNADFIGWDMIGYPGIRMPVDPGDQALGAKPRPNRESAYSNAIFGMAGHGR